MSEIHFVAKTRYQDLTETGSFTTDCGLGIKTGLGIKSGLRTVDYGLRW